MKQSQSENKLSSKYFKAGLLAVLLIINSSLFAQIKHALRDENGRHVVPRGYVVNTNDGNLGMYFTPDDYVRMVRMGANFQVVRLELGKLSTFPGCSLDENYLIKLDSLVAMGKHVGMRTVFKMTVYGVDNFLWEKFWVNENNENQTYIDAWKVVWKRYANEPWVLGYDIVNEPRKLTMGLTYSELTSRYLVPLYQKIIDESQKINPDKMCLCQSIFMNKGEAINNNQYAEFSIPINRKNIVFAPHIYQEKIDFILPTMLRFDKESDLLNAPILIGEWGFPTFDKTDSTMYGHLGQLNYMEFYIRTAEIFDSLGVGSIKAWFSGNRNKQHFLSGGPSTWAIFSDMKSIGTIERKYITDIIARPYPQTIAGDINSFKFDFATRCLEVYITTDNSKGTSQLFIGADRHYPDGFSIVCNDDFIMSYNPLKNTGFELVKYNEDSNPSDFIWDESRQQLIVLKWPEDKANLHLKIVPGIL